MLTRYLYVLVTMVLVAGAVAAQTDCPDQTNVSPIDYDLNVNGVTSAAQTFTADAGGLLAEIEVHLDRIGQPAGPLVLELRATMDGEPDENDAAVLAQQFVAPEAIDGPTTVIFDVSAIELEVSPGVMYAVSFRSPVSGNDPTADVYVVLGGGGNPYPGGKGYFRAFSPEWQRAHDDDGATVDFAFTTYLDCSTPTVSNSWSSVRASYR